MAKTKKGFAKIVLIMKLTTVLLMFSCIQISATSYSQNSIVSVDFADANISTVFNLIENQTPFTVFFKNSQIDIHQNIKVNNGSQTVRDLLLKVVEQTNTKFDVLDKIIVITENTSFQPLVVSGTVTDAETGSPLVGVTIMIEGTSQGVITDRNGKYEIEVANDNTVLVFSYIGYETRDIVVGQNTVIDLQLEVSTSALDEVVVIGFGTQRRRDLTGSVASVSSSEIENLSFSNIDRAIQGKLSGVTIQQNTEPGGNASIRIRGLSTINNNNPLIVVDGIPSTNGLQDLNPNSIETIDVLKDASATAIFGNRASNGVIIVTTKRGELGQKTKVNFNAEYGVANVMKHVDVLNAEEYMLIMNESIENAVEQGLMTDNISREMELYEPQDTDWQNVIYRQGYQTQYDLSISGGTDQTRFFMSGGYTDIEGVVIESDYTRFNFTSNIEHSISDKFKVGENMHISYSDRADSYTHTNSGWSGIMQQALTTAPQFPIYHEGQMAFGLAGDRPFYGEGNNPLYGAAGGGNNHLTRIVGNAYLNYEIVDGLEYKSTLGIDYSNNEYDNYVPPKTLARVPRNDNLSNSFSKNQNWSWYNTLTYTTTFDQHKLVLLLGNSLEKTNVTYFSARRDKLLSSEPPFQFIDFGDPELQSTSGNAGVLALTSQFGRINYNYGEKYLVTATIRRDGSSRFYQSENKFGIFPSASFAWRLSEENFLKDVSAISNMKLRMGWGKVGNQSVGSYYPYLDILALNYNYPFGPGDGILNIGVAEASRGNPRLSWESNVMTNIGIDMGFLKGKFSIVADYFINTTEDMLLSVALPAVGGKSKVPDQNAGSISTRGVEFDARYHYKVGDVKFDIGLNATKIKNEVLDLAGSDFILGSARYQGSDNPIRTIVGYPISSYYGYVVEGVFQNQDEIDNHAVQETNTGPGDLKYKDINEDGFITSEDRIVLGNGFPELTYGFTLGANFKNFDFLLFLQGVNGVDIYNAMNMHLMHGGNRTNKHIDILDRWTEEGNTSGIPRVHYLDPNNNDRVSDYFIEKGDYLRVKNVQVGYSIPLSAIQRIGIERLRMYLSVQNPITFTEYSGANPDIIPVGGDEDMNHGFDSGAYPIPRTILAGIKITL